MFRFTHALTVIQQLMDKYQSDRGDSWRHYPTEYHVRHLLAHIDHYNTIDTDSGMSNLVHAAVRALMALGVSLNPPKKAVIESPYTGDIDRNSRYLAWCCREMHLDGFEPLATHAICPIYLRDNNYSWNYSWAWMPEVPHYFFIDLGWSDGMFSARQRCSEFGIPIVEKYLRDRIPFDRGDWPCATAHDMVYSMCGREPHTKRK